MAAEQHYCERHHRPAVPSRVRVLPDGTRKTEYLCEIDVAEERMSGRLGGRSLFGDFFSGFFGDAGASGAETAAAPPRPGERGGGTEVFSGGTRGVLRRAGQTA